MNRTSRRSRGRRAAIRSGTSVVPESAEKDGDWVQVWDLPTRINHWALVVLVGFLIGSGQFGLLNPQWHIWFGLMLLTALVFRLLWGLIGSESARFGTMICSVRQLPAYIPVLLSRKHSNWPGHNPMGALSSLSLWALLSISCMSGLFIESWGDHRGPLADRVGRNVNLFMTDLHSLVQWPLYALIAIHMLAAFWYLLFKREDRIGPIFGQGRIFLPTSVKLDPASNRRALIVLAASLAMVGAITFLGPID